MSTDRLNPSGTGSGILKRALFVLAFVVLALFQLYPTLSSYFLADDFAWLRFARNQPTILNAVAVPSVGDWTTPVSNAFFWTLYRTFGLNPVGYYLAIGVLHLINSYLVFYLVRSISNRPTVAVLAAGIFCFHFLHWSDWGPLVWISAFVQLLVALFYLLTLILAVRFFGTGLSLGNVVVLGAFILALAAKETAMTLPIVLASWYFLGIFPAIKNWRSLGLYLLPFLVVLGTYLAYKLLVQQTSDRYFQAGLYGVGWHVLTNWKFFSNLIMPNPASPPVQSFLARNLPAGALQAVGILVGMARVGLAAGALIILRSKTPRHRAWLALAIVSYLPFIAFSNDLAGAARYFYLPAVGFSALLAEGLIWVRARTTRVRTLGRMAPVWVGLLAVVVWTVNLAPVRAWQSQMTDNSTVKTEYLDVMQAYVAQRQDPPEAVILRGFSAGDLGDIEKMTQLLYGLTPTILDRDDTYPAELAPNTVAVEFRSGTPTIVNP